MNVFFWLGWVILAILFIVIIIPVGIGAAVQAVIRAIHSTRDPQDERDKNGKE